MKITIYTISDCQFSKTEKEYLQKNNLPFEEKNLEQNKEWLTEMLAVSNNFAGTPVTKIEKDNGKIEVLKGFTQEEFDQVLGFKKEESVTQASADVTVPPSSQPSPTQPATTESQTQPPSQPTNQTPPPPTAETTQPTTPPPTNPIPNPNQPNDPLASVLSDLEQKANPNPPPPSSSQSAANMPNIPDFNQ